MGKYGTTRTLNENTGRMVSVDAPRHTFADGENGVIDYDGKTNRAVLHGNTRDYVPSGRHFKTKEEGAECGNAQRCYRLSGRC